MKIVNPYRPGAGQMPMYLAGRDSEIEDARKIFEALCSNIPVQSIVYCGLRGVGKTVLINKLENIADEMSIQYYHIEGDLNCDFISKVVECCQVYLRRNSMTEKLKSIKDKAIDTIKSIMISYKPESGEFAFGVQDRQLYQTADLAQSMSELLASVGAIAFESEKPICFFIDEMQYINAKDLGALIAGIHRTNQLGYPIMIVGAGLPKLYKMLSDIKSYSERLFIFREVDSLKKEQAFEAIVRPALKLNVKYEDAAAERIFHITKGYPFFIQMLCRTIFNESEDIVTLQNVEASIDEYYEELDGSFFMSRYSKCSDGEKKFIFAMVDCGQLPCTIANVAKNLGKPVNSISPARGQLINKGIIYPVRHSELDFTVPEFDGFIKRREEYRNR